MKALSFREYTAMDNPFVTKGICAIESLEREADTSLPLIDDFQQTVCHYLSNINNQSSTLTIIAEIDNQPCGFAMGIVESQNSPFTSLSKHALIQAVWVEPKQLRKGLGKMLVEELLASFAEFKVPYCDIAYHPKNQTAQKFWHKLGFIDAQITARKFLT